MDAQRVLAAADHPATRGLDPGHRSVDPGRRPVRQVDPGVLDTALLPDPLPLPLGGGQVERQGAAAAGVPRKTIGPSRKRSSMPNASR